MSELPKSRIRLVEYGESHAAVWEQNAGAINVPAQLATDISSSTLLGRQLYIQMQEKEQERKAATEAFYNATDDLRRLLADGVAAIKQHAVATDNKAVYQLAEIDPPKKPSPRPAPAIPANFTGSINNEGQVELTWKARRTGGVMFTIERRLTPVGGDAGSWTELATVQSKTFVDENVPVGMREVTYRVKAVRGDLASIFTDSVNIAFGSESGTQSSSSLPFEGGNVSKAA